MTREVKLHLYVRQEYEFLNSMIKEEILSIVSQPPELEITGNIASNWLREYEVKNLRSTACSR